jgi:signal transduction histidine kinase
VDLKETEFHPASGDGIRRQDDAKDGVSVYNVAMKWFKVLWNIINKNPLIGDSLLTLVLVVSAFFNLRALWGMEPPSVHLVLAIALVALMIIPLIWRRIVPAGVVLISTVAAVILQILNILEGNFTVIVLSIAIFSIALYGGTKRKFVFITSIAVITAAQVFRLVFNDGFVLMSNATLFYLTNVIWNLIIFLAIWWFGNTLRLSREQARQLKESTEQLRRERKENAHRAVVDERIRIARELHDVLAHHVSVMGIQAGAARQVLKQYPEKALNALNLIETSSRQAVTELYSLLGLLRDEKQVEKFTSQPGLQQLDKLITDMQNSGLQVEIKTEGENREIPEMVDLSAYRILEESLTNILKHARATKATIHINYQNDRLLLNIADNGYGVISTGEITSSGKGLIGMRERVNLLKGEFWAGNRPEGGFLVKVNLPLGEPR